MAGIVVGLLLSVFLTQMILGVPMILFSWQGLLFGVLAVAAAYQTLRW